MPAPTSAEAGPARPAAPTFEGVEARHRPVGGWPVAGERSGDVSKDDRFPDERSTTSTRDDSALLANTPETDRHPYEVFDAYQQGFITHAEYTLFQIRRQDTAGYRELLCSIVGIDLGGQTDEDLALAYHGFMVLHFGKPSVR